MVRFPGGDYNDNFGPLLVLDNQAAPETFDDPSTLERLVGLSKARAEDASKPREGQLLSSVVKSSGLSHFGDAEMDVFTSLFSEYANALVAAREAGTIRSKTTPMPDKGVGLTAAPIPSAMEETADICQRPPCVGTPP